MTTFMFNGGLPPSPATSDDLAWDSSSSGLAFLSSQLVSHGFARPPGLVQPLSRLSREDLEPVSKCLRDLLEQRITDMERTEELTARFRSLSQDHERLLGLHKAAKERILSAQRECELAKSKHATTTTAYVELQATQKQTAFNLQKAQSALVFARQTAQNEIKRKDKEIERIQDRWTKLANDQPKAGNAIGMKCANVVADHGVPPKGPSLLEISLAQLKGDHERLVSQNESFRTILITLATKLDTVTRRGEPTKTQRPITDLNLFPPTEQPWKEDAENARGALHELLLRVEVQLRGMPQETDAVVTNKTVEALAERERALKEKLATEVESLKEELERSRQALTEQMNGALDAFARDQRLLRGQPRESVDGPCPGAKPVVHEQRERELEERERRLEESNEQLTASAIQLGKERSALAAARLELEEEKRSWKLQQMIDDLPDSPQALLSSSRTNHDPIPAPLFAAEPRRAKTRSPKKSSVATSTRRVSPTKRSPRKIVPHVAATRAPLFDDLIDEVDEAEERPLPMSASSSSTSTNPFDQILAQSAQAAQSLNKLNLSPERKTRATVEPTFAPLLEEEEETSPIEEDAPRLPTPVASPLSSTLNPPLTPVSLSAAQARMKKNPYAPAVPSPLSRILRMADSPPIDGLASLSEESSATGTSTGTIPAPRWTLAKLVEGDDEDEEEEGRGSFVPVPMVSLAEELGLENGENISQATRSPFTKRHRATSPRKTKDKGKSKLLGTPPRATVPASLLRVREKENAAPATGPFGPPSSSAPTTNSGQLGTNRLGAASTNKITIGARVVGGRPTTTSAHIAKGGKVPIKGVTTAAGGPRSLRDRVSSRYGQMPSSSMLPRGD